MNLNYKHFDFVLFFLLPFQIGQSTMVNKYTFGLKYATLLNVSMIVLYGWDFVRSIHL